MKGIVFVELLEMAESALGEDQVDAIIGSCALPSGGAYSAVGQYSCGELVTLVQAFSSAVSVPGSELQRQFGHWMHQKFVAGYPAFYAAHNDPLSMLESIEREVHVEVRKLYPDAELPRFDTERLGPGALRMTYASPRPLADFCHGLVEACIAHFGAKADIRRRNLSDGTMVIAEFSITLRSTGGD